MRFRSIVFAVALAMVSQVWADDPVELRLLAPDSVYGLYVRNRIEDQAQVPPVTVHLFARSRNAKEQPLTVGLRALDMQGANLPWAQQLELTLPADGQPVTSKIELNLGLGFFEVLAEATVARSVVRSALQVGVLPPTAPGVRPDSAFAVSAAAVPTGADAELLRLLGLKVVRVELAPPCKPDDAAAWRATPLGAGVPLDFAALDAALKDAEGKELTVLPLVGGALRTADYVARSALAAHLEVAGPPRDLDEWVKTWQAMLAHYPAFRAVEFGNQAAVYAGTWAGTAAAYRDAQQRWLTMARQANPELRVYAGSSAPFFEEHLAKDPAAVKAALAGTALQPATDSRARTSWRTGELWRALDYGLQVTRNAGLSDCLATGGDSDYRLPPPAELVEIEAQLAENQQSRGRFTTEADKQRPEYAALQREAAALAAARTRVMSGLPEPRNNFENASKLVQYLVRQALAGGRQGDLRWGSGVGPALTRTNVAVGVLTHLLEDRPVVADLWPAHELLTGAVFAHPRHVTDAVKQLPRAAELATRWRVAVPDSRAGDATKVAVVFANTGPADGELDGKATLTVETAGGALRAFDLCGRELPAADGKLSVALGSTPVYLVSDTLDLADFCQRVANAKLAKLTPVNFYAMPLSRPADQQQDLLVRVQSQLNVPAELRVIVSDLAGKELGAKAAAVPAGGLVDVAVPWPGVAATPANQYGVRVAVGIRTASTTFVKQTRPQLLSVARVVKKTIAVDGDLGDWAGVPPLVLDSALWRPGADVGQYLANPNLDATTEFDGRPRVVVQARAAYDEQFVYLAWAVHEERFACRAGAPALAGVKDVAARAGWPGGVGHVCTQGDYVQFACGCRDRMPGVGRQLGDPWAWKGHFYDTDYAFAAHASNAGDQLVQHWTAEGARRNGYQGEPVPGLEPVPGGQLKIKRDEATKMTVYEAAVPRAALKLFDPAAGRLRLHFVVGTDEGLGELNVAAGAGVFDYWRGFGSLPPTWQPRLPAQVYWGIEP